MRVVAGNRKTRATSQQLGALDRLEGVGLQLLRVGVSQDELRKGGASDPRAERAVPREVLPPVRVGVAQAQKLVGQDADRKSTRLNSSHT